MRDHIMRPRTARLFVLLLPLLVLFAGCASGSSFPAAAIPTPSGGDLRLSTDHPTYDVHSPVGVVLLNLGQSDYYATDGRSACTLVQLQQYDPGRRTWLAADGCTPSQQPRPLAIPAGMREPFTLAPGSASDADAWQPGLYRVALTYSANSDGVSGAQSAYSAGFIIQN